MGSTLRLSFKRIKSLVSSAVEAQGEKLCEISFHRDCNKEDKGRAALYALCECTTREGDSMEFALTYRAILEPVFLYLNRCGYDYSKNPAIMWSDSNESFTEFELWFSNVSRKQPAVSQEKQLPGSKQKKSRKRALKNKQK